MAQLKFPGFPRQPLTPIERLVQKKAVAAEAETAVVTAAPGVALAAATKSEADSQWQDINPSQLVETKIESTNPEADSALPSTLTMTKLQLGNGASMEVADNFGATPMQVTTGNNQKLVHTKIVPGATYTRTDLKGAAIFCGMPWTIPLGRTFDKNGAPVMEHEDIRVEFDSRHIGPNKRIAPYKTMIDQEAMTHGGIFTSPCWTRGKMQSLGASPSQAVKVTYTLNLEDDPVLRVMGKGKVEATYILADIGDGQIAFDSILKVTATDKPILLGPVAQHSFLKVGARDTLQTSAGKKFEIKDYVPTGEVLPVTKEQDFTTPKLVNEDKKSLEVVLTGYEGLPEFEITRPDDNLIVKSQMTSTGNSPALLLCDKLGPDNVMAEWVEGGPPNGCRPDVDKSNFTPVVVKLGEPFEMQTRLITRAIK